jgi:uncharacterized protein (DUF58 family)
VTDTVPLTPEGVLHRVQWHVLRRLDGRLQGDYRTLWRGSGIDVADLREYTIGDEARHIDWNVTARTDVVHVREYLQDREVTAWLLLDTSSSMRFGAEDRRKQQVLAEVTATVAQLLSRGGNLVGALLFDADVRETIPPRHGREQVLRILHRLLAARTPATDGAAAGTDLAAALRAMIGIGRRRSLIVVVSDLLTPVGWERPLSALAPRHDVVLLHVTDPRETELPSVGLVWVEDAETGEQLLIDTDDPEFRARLADGAARRRADLTAAARSAGVDLFTIGTDDDLLTALLRIADLRRRRRR